MKKYLIIMNFIGSTIILERINAKDDSEAIKLTALTIVEESWIDIESKDEIEQKKQDIEWAKTEPLNLIQDFSSSSDLKEVILYDISNDKIVIQE